jgi:hypothetical protein
MGRENCQGGRERDCAAGKTVALSMDLELFASIVEKVCMEFACLIMFANNVITSYLVLEESL